MVNKKLQIFISSTYTDLLEERQAAVEAILEARHIPAGMELFAAGDESQLQIIRRWIDESDVFLLILGGRYGSVRRGGRKSYVELEYLHAGDSGKPIISLIMSDTLLEKRKLDRGSAAVTETERPKEYRAFKADVLKGRMCREFDDSKDIKIQFRNSLDPLIEHTSPDRLRGWIRGPGAAPTHATQLADAFERSGLRSAFRIKADNARRDERVKQLVEEEAARGGESCFRLTASSGANYLLPDGKVWRQAGLGALVWDNKPFQVVLESPFSSFAETRALANGIAHHHWMDKMPLPRLRELQGHPNIAVRVTEHAVNCSLFLTQSAVLYDPYLWAHPGAGGRTENNFWVFEFRRDEDGSRSECYSVLEKHFEFLWSTGVPLDTFLGNDDANYYRRSREFEQKMAAARATSGASQ